MPRPNVIDFYQIVPGGMPPCRASPDAMGTLPIRGARHCEVIRSANAFGFYIFPPIDFSLMTNGASPLFQFGAGDEWYPLHDAVQYPEFAHQFDAIAPDDCKAYSPPWLAVTQTGL